MGWGGFLYSYVNLAKLKLKGIPRIPFPLRSWVGIGQRETGTRFRRQNWNSGHFYAMKVRHACSSRLTETMRWHILWAQSGSQAPCPLPLITCVSGSESWSRCCAAQRQRASACPAGHTSQRQTGVPLEPHRFQCLTLLYFTLIFPSCRWPWGPEPARTRLQSSTHIWMLDQFPQWRAFNPIVKTFICAAHRILLPGLNSDVLTQAKVQCSDC